MMTLQPQPMRQPLAAPSVRKSERSQLLARMRQPLAAPWVRKGKRSQLFARMRQPLLAVARQGNDHQLLARIRQPLAAPLAPGQPPPGPAASPQGRNLANGVATTIAQRRKAAANPMRRQHARPLPQQAPPLDSNPGVCLYRRHRRRHHNPSQSQPLAAFGLGTTIVCQSRALILQDVGSMPETN